jgi:hypothetical protein
MSISYAETRDSEHLRLLTPAIDAFINHVQNPAATASTCPRQTVFFFPGGMASQLVRARQPFQDGLTVPQTFSYDPVWITPFVFTIGTAQHLKMQRDAAGVFRDKDDRIIVALGLVNLLGCTPYNGFLSWCTANNLDVFVFDWDWRRRLEETVTFFVTKFLPFFQARVIGAGLPDPLATFSLIGHSFGGMIANLVLRRNDSILAPLARVITVATPFYGYPGQVHRWFEGEPVLNGLFGSNTFKQEMMDMIASLPAPYTLHFLDEATFGDSATVSALTTLAPEFPLPGYPSMDATTAGLRADPYNPQTNGSLVRYPVLTGFDLGELDYARLQFQQLAAPMAPNLLQKFYNIRGVRTQLDQQTPISDTPGSVTWDWIPTTFDETDPTPIIDSGHVPGDDTQPAWSAHLATNDPARRITVRASNVHHMFLMNHSKTLQELESILCASGVAMRSPITNQPEPASDEDLIAFMRWLDTQRGRKTWPRLDDPKILRVVPAEFREKLPAIAARIMMDILKRPAPPALSGLTDRGTGPRPKRPKPRRRKKPTGKPARRKPASRRRRPRRRR